MAVSNLLWLWDMLSSSVYILFLVPLIFYCYTTDNIHLVAFIWSIVTLITSETLKRVIFWNFKRPVGACNCGLINTDKCDGNEPGMPSSHVAFVTFLFTYYIYHLQPKWRNIAILYLVGVSLSRYFKKCHTELQIIGGIMLGYFIKTTSSLIEIKV